MEVEIEQNPSHFCKIRAIFRASNKAVQRIRIFQTFLRTSGRRL